MQALRVCRKSMAVLETAGRGSIPRRGAETKYVLGVLRIARDPAKVEDQVRLLARTLNDMALEPDGKATACKAVMNWVRPPPASLIRPGQRRTRPVSRQSVACVPCMGSDQVVVSTRLAQWKERQPIKLAVTGSTPVPHREC